ncbi:hypothetical protein [Roseomonas sp. AR75]|uniref:hypothetical protein n=1 Tax=Roseomonas sp. AR75 TaxID=2562311 RepID=UPI0010C0CE9B|nr:hypothetical protein [Roseomonas sp. AR75]
MSNRTTLDQLRAMSAAQVDALPLDHLALLLEDAADLRAEAKRVSDLLHDALHARFAEAASATRRAEGKDTGRVRLERDGFELIADLPKKVDWQQAKLTAAVSTLREWGEDPADYVATQLHVPEARFSAWPPRIRALFEPARTVAAGRPTYTLKRIEA